MQDGTAIEAEAQASFVRGAALRRQAIQTLRSKGYTLESIAAALGISRQRVEQLAKADNSSYHSMTPTSMRSMPL